MDWKALIGVIILLFCITLLALAFGTSMLSTQSQLQDLNSSLNEIRAFQQWQYFIDHWDSNIQHNGLASLIIATRSQQEVFDQNDAFVAQWQSQCVPAWQDFNAGLLYYACKVKQ